MPTLVLVHSPFLGPASLRPLSDALSARGPHTVLLDLRATVAGSPVIARMTGSFADALTEAAIAEPPVLVGHSGAGPLLPAFADALDDGAAGLVLLDADVPTPGRSWRDDAPPELYASMKAKSRDGMMPPWPQWFDDELLRRLVPDDELRAEVLDEAPEVPLAFLKEERFQTEWDGPAGYVRLSAAYDDAAAAAELRGWPVARLDTHHLAAATEPDLVADALVTVLRELGLT